ncbi:MAG: DUF2939 domain-containing protein [Hyphomicrobiaceae bacterium]|nr:DUF2939 domain-containing protein [Hyphomicrobiaceae bacterium]
MRRWLPRLAVCLVLAAAALYAASPFYTAYAIREAVKSGDADFLRDAIEWTPVRASLRASMLDIAVGPGTGVPLPEGAPPKDTGLWANIKSYVGHSFVDGFVNRYATPEGLPTVFSYGRTVRRNVLMRDDPEEGLALPQKLAFIWTRVRRASFVGLSRFEMEMTDSYEPGRSYAGVLEFHGTGPGLGWKLVDLRVLQVKSGTEPDATSAADQVTTVR